MTRERIQKALSAAGVASRRSSEELVAEGRVSVNGQVVTELPVFVDLSADDVRVDGQRIRAHRGGPKIYFLLNKPKGVVCTQSDPQGRPRAVDLLPDLPQRIYCVGRLDVDSTGLILLTNDGDLTERLTHPRYGIMKHYEVEVDGRVEPEALDRLKGGMYIDGKKTQRTAVRVIDRGKRTVLQLGLSEGRNREIRRMLTRLGHKVRRLKRTAIGPVTDRGLGVGHWRELSKKEVALLRKAGPGKPGGAPKKASRSRRGPSAGGASKRGGRKPKS